MDDLTSRRPYLIRALYEWVLDNNLTPHLLVAADTPGVDVPRQFVTEEGRITINVSPSAVRGLQMGNDWITFSARFSGRNHDIGIPPGAVLAVYARENGEGMLFGDVEAAQQSDGDDGNGNGTDEASSDAEQAASSSKQRPSHLRVIK